MRGSGRGGRGGGAVGAATSERTKTGKPKRRRGDGHDGVGNNRYWCSLPMEYLLRGYLMEWMDTSNNRAAMNAKIFQAYFGMFQFDDKKEPWTDVTRKKRERVRVSL
jgi:hypothetical protein